MANLNIFYLDGYVLKKPVLQEAKNGKKFTKVSIIVHKIETKSEIYYITAFDKKAEKMVQTLERNDLVNFRGKLHPVVFENSHGRSTYQLELIADGFTIIFRREDKKEEIPQVNVEESKREWTEEERKEFFEKHTAKKGVDPVIFDDELF